MVGEYFRARFQARSGVAPYEFEVTRGQLPPGLELRHLDICHCPINEVCVCEDDVWVQGTPTSPGTYSFELTAVDKDGEKGVGSFKSRISLPAFLGQGFELDIGQSAVVKDYRNMIITYNTNIPCSPCPEGAICEPCEPPGVILSVSPGENIAVPTLTNPQPETPVQVTGSSGIAPQITGKIAAGKPVAVDNPGVKVESVSIPVSSGVKSETGSSVSMLRLHVGESARAFGATITLMELNEEKALLLVTAEDYQEFRVISPNGGEVWRKGSVETIRWTSTNEAPSSRGSGGGSSGSGGVETSTSAMVYPTTGKVVGEASSGSVAVGSPGASSPITGTKICPTIICSVNDCPYGCEVGASGCLTGRCNPEPRMLIVSDADWPEDPYFLLDLDTIVTDDILNIDVSYSGGCEEHDFNLIWDGSFLKSSPAQAEVYLSHDAKGDSCEAEISKSLSFDLTPMKSVYLGSYSDIEPIIIKFRDHGDVDYHTIRYEHSGSGDGLVVFLDQKFELRHGQTAIVENYRNMRITHMGGVGVCPECIQVPNSGACPPCRNGITLSVSISSENSGAGTTINLFEGDKKEVFGAVIELLEIEDGSARLIVKKQPTTNPSSVSIYLISDTPQCTGGACPAAPSRFYTIAENVPDNGIFKWQVGDVSSRAGIPEGKYAIQVCIYDEGSEQCDQSDSSFRIVGKSGKRPVCSHIGTDREGWYIENELIKRDTCKCTAICRQAPVVDDEPMGGPGFVEGFYSSCTGNLIMPANCEAATEISGVSEAVEVVVPASPGRGTVSIMDSEQAWKRAQESGRVDEITKIEIDEEDGEIVYKIRGNQLEFFLGIIPYNVEKSFSINAESGDLIE